MRRRTGSRRRAVILVSGRGTNMAALIAAAADPAYPAAIERVICNRPQAPAIGLARAAAIAVDVIDHRQFASREAHEAAIAAALDGARPDIICLAGYMRVLTGGFVRGHAGRMINIHPSLLPAFPGIDTHERALAAGVRIHGASVHFVTEDVDQGPIIAQAAVPVLPDDDAATLAARVLAAENRLYPQALAMVASGSARMSGGRVVFARLGEVRAADVLISPPLR